MLKAILKLNTMSIDNQKLILTPNGYKAGKNYSIKPTDGSGDFTMSRGTSKTRVNKKIIESVGNDVLPADYTNADCPVLAIEPQRTNLIEFSEDFSNAVWEKDNGATIDSNTGLAPNGTTTADRLNIPNENDRVRQLVGLTSDKNYLFSFFAKADEGNVIQVEFNGTTWSFPSPLGKGIFDLANETATTSSSLINAEIKNYNNGIYRCIITNRAKSTASSFVDIGNFGSTNGSVFIWGAQLEEALTPTSYIPTTSSTVTRNQDILTNDLTPTIDASYSALIKVEAENSRLKIEDTNTGFDLPLNGTGNIAMVVDNEITFHFPDNGQANTTVTYDKPADLRNLEILSKLGRTGLAILSIENGIISQSKIDDWVSGNVTSDWLTDYSSQTNLDSEFRDEEWDYFPAIDLSSGTDFSVAWSGNNLTSFPAIDSSSGTNFLAAWQFNNLTSFPAIDLSSGTNFFAAWRENNLTSFPAIDLSNGTDFEQTWRDNNLTSFPAIDLSSGTDFFRAWQNNNLTSFPANMFDNNNASNYFQSFRFNALDQQSVDNILVSIEASAQANNITNGTLGIQSGTNATPSQAGKDAADSLRNTFNWTVGLNGY